MNRAPSWEIDVQPAREAIDRAEVARTLRLFWEPGARHAIQALRSGRWELATLDNIDHALEVVEGFADERGVYFGLNPLRPDFQRPEKGGWRNPDIARRRWFLIDADATRPEGTNATEAEKAASKAVADAVAAELAARSWPEPIKADSANGYHLYYRIDIPNDKPSQKLLSAALKALAARHDTEGAAIDRGVHDAKRITKLFGTWARKAPHSIDRPHRMARLLAVPDSIIPVPPPLIQALAAPETAPSTPFTPSEQASPNGHANGHHEPKNGWTVETSGATENAYARAALEAESAKVAGATTNRNHQLYESALKIGGYVATGQLDETAARAALESAAAACGLGKDGDPAEVARAIDNGFSTGKQAPKTPPPPKNGRKPRDSKPTAVSPTGLKEAIDDERRLARIYLNASHAHEDRPTLLDWNGDWHAWSAGAWTPVPDRDIDASITDAVKAEYERVALATDSEVAQLPTRHLGNVRNALRAAVNLPVRRVPSQPVWLDGGGPPPAECVNFRNGVLHLPTLLSEGPAAALRPPSPLYFTANALEFDFDPNAPRPAAWLDFLGSIWPSDPESIRALQQWFGYLLTPDTSQQKLLLLLGPKRCGKGTIIRTLARLIGHTNIAAPKLSSLGKDFGAQCLIGKSVAFCTDARIAGRADTQAIVEVLLSITGEDPQTIGRKHKEDWHGRLPTRFVMAANELPRLGDYSEALLSRLIVLRFSESFEGREDFDLEKKITPEMPGIALWSIAGWEALRGSARLTQPDSGRDDLEAFKELNNPVGAFIADRCEIEPAAVTPKSHLYESWCQWCKDHGKDRPGDSPGFSRNLKTALAALSVKLLDCQPRDDTGRQVRAFRGIRLIDARPF